MCGVCHVGEDGWFVVFVVIFYDSNLNGHDEFMQVNRNYSKTKINNYHKIVPELKSIRRKLLGHISTAG